MDNMEMKLNKMVRFRAASKADARSNYRDQSRRRLVKVIETKINTTMIGALSAIEEHLGFLWGQGKPSGQLTDDELRMLTVKDVLRTAILNNGNNQKRAAVSEINQYDITWKRHHIDLYMDEQSHFPCNEEEG